METNIAAARLARSKGVMVAFNPAPAPEDGKLPAQLLQNLDVIIPNQTEASQLTGIDASDWHNARLAAAALRALGPRIVIITLGEQGAYVSEGDNGYYIDSFAVTALDTTAAGDAFCGAFAAAYSRRLPLSEAVRYGCAAGALACTKLGAEPSLPYMNEIDRLLSTRTTSKSQS